MRREFKVRPNFAVLVFTAALVIAGILNTAEIVNNTGKITTISYIFFMAFVVLMLLYFLGCRPTKYFVEDKAVVVKRRLLPNKTIDLMHAEVITDPESRMTDIVTRPHAIELYMDDKKRHKFFPLDAANFTGAVVGENKRIHCTVKAYTDVHRSVERRERKFRKKEERRRRRNAEGE